MFRGFVCSFIIAIAIIHDKTSWAKSVEDEVVYYTDVADLQATKSGQMLLDKLSRSIRTSVSCDNSKAAEEKSDTSVVNEPEQKSPTEKQEEDGSVITPQIPDDDTVTRKARSPQFGLLDSIFDYNDNDDYADSRYYKPHKYNKHKYGRGCRGLYYGYGCGGDDGSYYSDYYGNPGYNHGYGHRPGHLGYQPGYGGSGYRPGYGYGNSGSYAQASAGSYNNGYGPNYGGANSNAQSASFSLGPFMASFSNAEASARSRSN